MLPVPLPSYLLASAHCPTVLPQIEEPLFCNPESRRFLMLPFLLNRGGLRFLVSGLQVPINRGGRESQVLYGIKIVSGTICSFQDCFFLLGQFLRDLWFSSSKGPHKNVCGLNCTQERMNTRPATKSEDSQLKMFARDHPAMPTRPGRLRAADAPCL